MRKICALTFCRSEYSSLSAVLKALIKEKEITTQLLVGGSHLSEQHGKTVTEIESDGFKISERVPFLEFDDSPLGAAHSLGVAVTGIADALSRLNPDLLLVVGDRLELMAVATAALSLNLPVAHISGGDVTEGSRDNQIRHAISKISHLHFVSMESHKKRLIQMGEESSRIHVTGDPALDHLSEFKPIERASLGKSLGIQLTNPITVVTFHPDSLGNDPSKEIREVLGGLESIPGTVIFTNPNPDSGHSNITEAIDRYIAGHPGAVRVPSLGVKRYYSLLYYADLLVGNSSSGIWEAPSFKLPAVNIGRRQQNRTRAGNVIDVGVDAAAIAKAIKSALDPKFRATLQSIVNPYGDGQAASRIVDILKSTELGASLLLKIEPDLN